MTFTRIICQKGVQKQNKNIQKEIKEIKKVYKF